MAVVNSRVKFGVILKLASDGCSKMKCVWCPDGPSLLSVLAPSYHHYSSPVPKCLNVVTCTCNVPIAACTSTCLKVLPAHLHVPQLPVQCTWLDLCQVLAWTCTRLSVPLSQMYPDYTKFSVYNHVPESAIYVLRCLLQEQFIVVNKCGEGVMNSFENLK